MPGTYAHDANAPSLVGGFANPLVTAGINISTIVTNSLREEFSRVRLQTGTVTGTSGTPPTLDVEIQGCDDPNFTVNNSPVVSLGRFSQLNGAFTAGGVAGASWTNASPMVFTTSANHNFAVGQQVVMSATGLATLNGTWFVATVPSATTFTLAASNVLGPFAASLGATSTFTVTPVTVQSNITKYLDIDNQKLYLRAVVTLGGGAPSYGALVIDIDHPRYLRTPSDSA